MSLNSTLFVRKKTEGSLFHYTKTLDALSNILTLGFRYSYCFEEQSKRISLAENYTPLDDICLLGAIQPNYGIAIPMICFCDIPIMRATEHRAKYGDYCIGLNKKIVRKNNTINPLFYTSSNWVYDSIKKLYSYIPTQAEKIEYDRKQKEIVGDEIDPIKAAEIIKCAFDNGRLQKDIRFDIDFNCAINTIVTLLKKYEKGNDNYYNEHEWRAFFTLAEEPKHGFTREQFNNEKETLNKKLWENETNAYLRFDEQEKAITYIIVPTENEVTEIVNLIYNAKTIFGSLINDNIKKILISKITSFERIEADY